MTLTTRAVNGNNSGPYLRRPKVVVMHSTRSGIETKTDAEELESTINWFTNPDGASSHWVLSGKERVRVVSDDLIAWHSAYLNSRSWGIEFTQPTIDRPFQDGHYVNAALVGRHYVKLGVAPKWLSYWDGGDVSGFVAHEDTVQGRELGKTDPGPKFDRVRFIASLEDDMTDDDVLRLFKKFAAEVAIQPREADGTIVDAPARTVANMAARIRDINREVKDHADAKHAGEEHDHPLSGRTGKA